jgi:hypothetical protein
MDAPGLLPAISFLLEQIRVHAGVIVDTKGKVVADRKREVNLTHGIGRKVECVNKPAGGEKAKRNPPGRKTPLRRLGMGFPN